MYVCFLRSPIYFFTKQSLKKFETCVISVQSYTVFTTLTPCFHCRYERFFTCLSSSLENHWQDWKALITCQHYPAYCKGWARPAGFVASTWRTLSAFWFIMQGFVSLSNGNENFGMISLRNNGRFFKTTICSRLACHEAEVVPVRFTTRLPLLWTVTLTNTHHSH